MLSYLMRQSVSLLLAGCVIIQSLGMAPNRCCSTEKPDVSCQTQALAATGVGFALYLGYAPDIRIDVIQSLSHGLHSTVSLIKEQPSWFLLILTTLGMVRTGSVTHLMLEGTTDAEREAHLRQQWFGETDVFGAESPLAPLITNVQLSRWDPLNYLSVILSTPYGEIVVYIETDAGSKAIRSLTANFQDAEWMRKAYSEELMWVVSRWLKQIGYETVEVTELDFFKRSFQRWSGDGPAMGYRCEHGRLILDLASLPDSVPKRPHFQDLVRSAPANSGWVDATYGSAPMAEVPLDLGALDPRLGGLIVRLQEQMSNRIFSYDGSVILMDEGRAFDLNHSFSTRLPYEDASRQPIEAALCAGKIETAVVEDGFRSNGPIGFWNTGSDYDELNAWVQTHGYAFCITKNSAFLIMAKPPVSLQIEGADRAEQNANLMREWFQTMRLFPGDAPLRDIVTAVQFLGGNEEKMVADIMTRHGTIGVTLTALVTSREILRLRIATEGPNWLRRSISEQLVWIVLNWLGMNGFKSATFSGNQDFFSNIFKRWIPDGTLRYPVARLETILRTTPPVRSGLLTPDEKEAGPLAKTSHWPSIDRVPLTQFGMADWLPHGLLEETLDPLSVRWAAMDPRIASVVLSIRQLMETATRYLSVFWVGAEPLFDGTDVFRFFVGAMNITREIAPAARITHLINQMVLHDAGHPVAATDADRIFSSRYEMADVLEAVGVRGYAFRISKDGIFLIHADPRILSAQA